MFTNLANELGHHLAWFVVHPPAELETSKPGCRPLRIWRSPCWTATRAMQADEDNAEATYPRYTVSQYIYGYGSIPINTIFRGWTSIYQLFWCSPGVQGFDTLPYIYTWDRMEFHRNSWDMMWYADYYIYIYTHLVHHTNTTFRAFGNVEMCAFAKFLRCG